MMLILPRLLRVVVELEIEAVLRLLVFEAGLPLSQEYLIRIHVAPAIRIPNDDRPYGVNISLMRLVG